MAQRIRLKKEPPLDLRQQAFAYQLEAVQAVRDLEYAAIFHEQGLGKTKIAIDVALYWLEKKLVDTVLFIVKKSLLNNWQREFALHTFLEPKQITQDRRSNFYAFNSPARVMLTHYEVLKSEESRFRLFLRSRNVAAILDEATKIKNPNSALTRCFFDLAPLFKRRVVMTGTPVANRPYDVWALIWFLDQGRSLGNSFPEFRREFDLSNELSDDPVGQRRFEERLGELFAMISAFSVREVKSSGLVNLPEKVFRSTTTAWEPYQYDLYRQVRDTLRASVIRDGIPAEDKSEDLLKRILRLVQIASNPRLIDDSYSAEPGKLAPLCDEVERVVRSGEKCIVWTSFTENADWLARYMRSYGACRVHGKLALQTRNRAIDRFTSEPACRVLVATPGAAREGLTLTVANHVIFYDRTFGLDDYLQAQDRIHRISQSKTCYVTNLIMQDSIDEWVDVLLHSKQLAAQLAQGDISLEYYQSQMSYDFGHVLREILNIEQGE
jgi:SNF2 family DNA or RNA helicase